MNELQKKFKVVVNAEQYNTPQRRTKASIVEYEMNTIIPSDVFKETFIELLDERNYQEGELSQWRFATPEEIYVHLLRGKEVLNHEADNTWQIVVDDYYTFKRVIGYTYPDIHTIFTNTKYLDNYSSKLLGSNYTHEQGHKLGFNHDFKNTARRADSLCYLLNEAYERSWDIIYLGGNSAGDKVLKCHRSWKTLWLKKYCKWVRVR